MFVLKQRLCHDKDVRVERCASLSESLLEDSEIRIRAETG